MKVLGIDDNEAICKLFQVAFSSMGHEFTYTLSAKEGLELIRANKYDLLLLDFAIPEFSGKDLLEILNMEGLVGKQKIIVVTASSTIDKDLADLKAIGVADLIRKPVDLDELLARSTLIVT